jgi:hypothetical protein
VLNIEEKKFCVDTSKFMKDLETLDIHTCDTTCGFFFQNKFSMLRSRQVRGGGYESIIKNKKP